MDKIGGSTCRCPIQAKVSRCPTCKPGLINLGAALHELGSLSNNTSMVTEEQENMVRDRRLRDSRNFFDQSPPLWINHPTTSNGSLRVDTDIGKEAPPPLQPPNSPVSPQLPYEQFRLSREGLNDPWEGRLLGGRRINMKGRQRMFSGPNGSSSSSGSGSNSDRYAERMRERNISYRPYRIPRPKLLNMGSRVRTISATLHEEPESSRLLAPIPDSSPVSVTTDALRSMAIGEGASFSKTLDNGECISTVNFPRSRSAENLERRAMDVAATTLDGVSDKIEKLHVT